MMPERDLSEGTRVRLEGNLFWPICAAISLSGALSLYISSLVGMPHLGRELVDALNLIVGLFVAFALFWSLIGLLSVPTEGISNLGRLTVRNIKIPSTVVGICYTLCYAVPWIGVLLFIRSVIVR
jgi:hypothetical protein